MAKHKYIPRQRKPIDVEKFKNVFRDALTPAGQDDLFDQFCDMAYAVAIDAVEDEFAFLVEEDVERFLDASDADEVETFIRENALITASDLDNYVAQETLEEKFTELFEEYKQAKPGTLEKKIEESVQGEISEAITELVRRLDLESLYRWYFLKYEELEAARKICGRSFWGRLKWLLTGK